MEPGVRSNRHTFKEAHQLIVACEILRRKWPFGWEFGVVQDLYVNARKGRKHTLASDLLLSITKKEILLTIDKTLLHATKKQRENKPVHLFKLRACACCGKCPAAAEALH